MRTLRRTAPAALAVVAAGLLGACGGGGDSGGVATRSGAEGESAAAADDDAPTEEDVLEWVECMREQGIDVPDPSVDGEGNVMLGGGPRVVINGSASASASTDESGDDGDTPPEPPDPEEFRKARETCGDPPRAGGSFSEEDQQAFQDAALKMAQCMRDHGIDFPDPVFSEAGPGGAIVRSEEAPADGERRGPFGGFNLDDAEVQAAFEECRAELGDAFPGRPGAVGAVRAAAPGGGEG